ncbi:TPA: DUF167 domain-containing protein [Candidatus Woesearchaeota archaeon]|nr:DUF167 domain-containing protein [Candidatus Woesearchaeota archaeon]HII69043.1 DUF167 domain-containing protein [Candidatus Woesearchaeota archaeon]
MIDKPLPTEGSFKVIVRANSRKTEILGFDEAKEAYRIAVAAPPEGNKANFTLIKLLSKSTKKQVSILSGFTAKEKIVRIA